jgi:hypothetical protein
MAYKGSIGLVSRNIHDLGEKKFRLSRAVAAVTDAIVHKIWVTPTAFPSRARKLKFRLLESFGPTQGPKGSHIREVF